MSILTKKPAVANPLRAPEQTPEELAAADELAKIDAAIERRFQELVKEQVRKPQEKRLTDTACWKQAEREVRKVIAADRRAEFRRALAADARSVAHRNRHLLGAWATAAPYAAVAEAAWLADTAGLVSTSGALGLATAGAAATTAVVWRRLRKALATLGSEYYHRFRAGVGAGAVLCASAPLWPATLDGQAGLLAAGLLATTTAAAKYWRDQAPAYPKVDGTDDQTVVSTADDATKEVDAEARGIVDDWMRYIADEGQHLPGAKLTPVRPFDYGWIFEIELVRGKQRLDHVRQRLADIAAALNLPPRCVTPHPGRDELHVELIITTRDPDTTYTGPVIVREGGDIYIEVGPYVDGQGVERWHVASGQLSDEEYARALATEPERVGGSMNGGFVLGNKGAGKSRFLENIAIGLKRMGVVVVYLDPQEGASSPALMKHADWALRGLDSAEDSLGNVLALYTALQRIVEVRQDENTLWGVTGFQHTRRRPAIAVIVEECHKVFNIVDPESQTSFGELFGEIDRIGRKLGITFIGATQDPTQDSFGGSLVLRRGMTDVNAYALRYTGQNASLAINSLTNQPLGLLPKNRGYGYNPTGEKPHTAFRNRYSPDGVRKFFEQLPENVLDELAAHAAGPAYLDRHKVESAKIDQVRKRLEARRAKIRGENPGDTVTDETASTGSGRGTADTSTRGTVLAFPFPTPPATAPTPPAALTPAQTSALEALRQHGPMAPAKLGQTLGISREGAGKHLRALADKNAAVRRDDGTYVAAEAAEGSSA